MSIYGGQSPGDWPDPHGQYGSPHEQAHHQGYGHPGRYAPYGHYAPPPAGYYAPPPSGSPRGQAQAIITLVLNSIATVSCCSPFGIAGIVLSGIAVSRINTDPDSARKLTIWSWVMLVFTLVAILAFIGFAIWAEVTSPADSPSDYNSGDDYY